jgi:hypothetical protein
MLREIFNDNHILSQMVGSKVTKKFVCRRFWEVEQSLMQWRKDSSWVLHRGQRSIETRLQGRDWDRIFTSQPNKKLDLLWKMDPRPRWICDIQISLFQEPSETSLVVLEPLIFSDQMKRVLSVGVEVKIEFVDFIHDGLRQSNIKGSKVHRRWVASHTSLIFRVRSLKWTKGTTVYRRPKNVQWLYQNDELLDSARQVKPPF